MNDPWTRTTVWGLTMGAGVGLGGGGQRGKNYKNCNRTTNKIFKFLENIFLKMNK